MRGPGGRGGKRPEGERGPSQDYKGREKLGEKGTRGEAKGEGPERRGQSGRRRARPYRQGEAGSPGPRLCGLQPRALTSRPTSRQGRADFGRK